MMEHVPEEDVLKSSISTIKASVRITALSASRFTAPSKSEDSKPQKPIVGRENPAEAKREELNYGLPVPKVKSDKHQGQRKA
jgi:hypothetical protein